MLTSSFEFNDWLILNFWELLQLWTREWMMLEDVSSSYIIFHSSKRTTEEVYDEFEVV